MVELKIIEMEEFMINLVYTIPVNIKYLLSLITSFFLVIILLPKFINFMKVYKIHDNLRDLNIDHSMKKYIPSMGGLVLVSSVTISYVIFSNFNSIICTIMPLSYLGFASIGLLDDCIKVLRGKGGLNPIYKILGQLIISSVFFVLLSKRSYIISMPFNLNIPFTNIDHIYVGAFIFFIFVFTVLSGTSNAVNIADGLDGFAALNLLTSFTFLFIYTLTKKHSEISTFSCSIIGSILGFLWHNSYPAQIFMGDVGSLSYGGVLGILFILIEKELTLVLVGLIFFLEALSVILQRSYKLIKGKRLFKLTPIHHHYEMNGVHENKIVMRSFVISLISFILSIFLQFL